MKSKKQNIKDINYSVWEDIFTSLGLKRYAAGQVYQWLFMHGAASFDEMTNLSKDACRVLSENFYISRLKLLETLEAEDGTRKFLFELSDGKRIEDVLIPMAGTEAGHYNIGAGLCPRPRMTLCISSQVGCALGCRFCRTAQMGFARNLTPSEIVDQVLEVRESLRAQAKQSSALDCFVAPAPRNDGQLITNIVLMGMGEPLNNYDNVKQAIQILKDKNGLSFAQRRITLSTAGVVPGIKRMAKDKLGVKLAVSLNATTDEVRRQIMPLAGKYSIDEIIEACRIYHPPGSRWRTTFEYVLIGGVNDSMEDARRLAVLMARLPSKLNLIPFNPFSNCGFKKPDDMVLRDFYNYLYNKGIQVNTRESRGAEILAACGQLAST